MIQYLFKDADLAGGFFSRAIKWKTKGRFSHVELWLSGPANKAYCFSSREGEGASLKYIDTTAVPGLWTPVALLGITREQEVLMHGFALAMDAAKVRYDYLGILGIGTGQGEHDDRDRFCSEVCAEIAQKCAHWWPDIKRWLTSPTDLFRLATERNATL